MAEQNAPTARIAQLEFLRVLATAGIFVFHVWSTVPLSADTGLAGLLLARIPLLGTLGVILFNGMAGFVLSLPYLGHPEPRPIPHSLSFFRQRFGRICQHYYPVLILWTIPWLFAAVHDQGWLFSSKALLSHVVFVHTLHADLFFSIVPAFWWLGMLAQFYLVYPWLARFFEHFGAGKACILACALPWVAWACLTYLASQWPGGTLALVHYLSYFNLPVRLPEFALGMGLAYAWNRGLPLVHGPALLASPLGIRLLIPLATGLSLFFLLQKTFILALPPVLGHIYQVCWCLGCMLAMLRWSAARHVGNLPVFVNLAATSYGIYLLHQPLLGYADFFLRDLFSPTSRFFFLLIGVGLVCYKAALGLNLLVWRLYR